MQTESILNAEQNKILTPGDFSKIEPWNSITQKSECEVVARNIMVILKRTGNVFREISYEEYKSERLKDGSFSDREQEYFFEVINYCKSADTAKLFSEDWATL